MKDIRRELDDYRQLMEVPDRFEDGFSLSSLMGALFVGLIIIPGALYMQLLAGMGVGTAAQWVTVILFIEVAKRANAKLSRAQLFVIFYMTGALASQSVYGMPLFTQFLVRSEAAVARGISTLFPEWVAPSDPSAYETRSFFQWAWMPAIALIVFRMLFSKIDNAVMSYALFRQTSDVERLPFPMAPVGAQGLVALAEDGEDAPTKSSRWRWRNFSIGGAIGMAFGLVYLGLPTITGAFFDKPMQVFPIPFLDMTPYTDGVLPATATGISWDFGNVVLGMVFPFFAVVGSFIGAALMLLVNPILQHQGVLSNWKPGQSAVETLFVNNIDLYMSLGIGLSLSVAVVGVATAVVTIRRRNRADDDADGFEAAETAAIAERRRKRGDIPLPVIVGVYLFTSTAYIAVSGWLIGWHPGVMLVLLFYSFLYTPLISYVTARMEGLAGQVVEIPFVRELSFILSGYTGGVSVWFLPVPMNNYGSGTVFYRQAELTGTRFWSIWKADLVLFPIILVALLGFSSFIWSLDAIPSPAYPYTTQIWEFEARNACLVYSSTLGEYSEFAEALSGWKILVGFVAGLSVYFGLYAASAPMMLYYGLVKGLGNTMIHTLLPQFIGAMLGKYYFERKFGKIWRSYIVVLSSGFFCGMGLASMFFIGIRFLMGATNPLQY